MTSHHDAVTRWVEVTLGKSDKPLLDSNSILARDMDGGNIYSWGGHFELARPLRSRKGEVIAWLLNGDRYSVSTTQHQSHIRGACQSTGLPCVVIPHSALRAADINLNSIEIIEDRAATWLPTDHESFVKPNTWETVTEATDDQGRTVYRWTTRRHRLGESLIRAKVKVTLNEACKPCNGTGEGINSFCGECNGRGRRYHTSTRSALFLSGFDHQERQPLYFFCELPRGVKPTTVAEAYEALKPEPVKLAEANGRSVLRQGDIFAIPVPDTDLRSLRKMGATIEKRGRVLGTSHVASEVAYLPNGTTLMRGTMYHEPEQFRPADHKRVTLPKSTWCIAVKNTCPLAV